MVQWRAKRASSSPFLTWTVKPYGLSLAGVNLEYAQHADVGHKRHRYALNMYQAYRTGRALPYVHYVAS